jgi:nicotinamide-nucleotide amidase
MAEERPGVPAAGPPVGGPPVGGPPVGGAPVGGAPAGTGLAGEILGLMRSRGQTLAVAESLTGGMLCAALTDIPGASAVVRGAIVAYATDLKAVLLGVPRVLLERHGAVHPDVAAAMADGVRRRLGAGVGVATTGVAGPDLQDNQPAGTVHIAVAADGDVVVRTLALPGDRAAVRAAAVAAALRLLLGQFAGQIREETS